MKRGTVLLLLIACLLGCFGCTRSVMSDESETCFGEWVAEENIAYRMHARGVDASLEECGGALLLSEYGKQEHLWLFCRVAEGQYLIQNEASGMYLSALEDGSVGVSETMHSATRWRAERMADGGCRLAIASQENAWLEASEHGVSCGTRATVWEMRALTLRLNVYYDPAFAESYEKKGIYAVDALERILLENTTDSEQYRGVAQFFREELHIQLMLDLVDEPHNSYPYLAGCLYRNDPTASCQGCLGEVIDGYTEKEYCQSGYHHKDADHIIRSVEASDAEFNLLFTGHRATCACDELRDGDVIHVADKSGIYGRSEGIGCGNRVAVFLNAFGDIEEYDRIKFTVVHEVTHLLGGEHHWMNEESCIHGVVDLNEAPLWNVTEDHLLLPLCSACLACFHEGKAAILQGHKG